MWVIVKKKFRDKYTNEIHEVGKKMNLKAARVKELKAAGNYVEELKDGESEAE